jgi:uncharacterized damage-inducible protein DinB
MYHTIAEFLEDWKEESKNTAKILDALTTASLKQKETKDGRSLGHIAWHIAGAVPEMMSLTGLKMTRVGEKAPKTAAAIAESYKKSAKQLARLIKANWNDKTLCVVDDMYGMEWPRGLTLQILLRHEIHHRAQMTILMRQAGLKVPGVYGPSREEWAAMGMEAPH